MKTVKFRFDIYRRIEFSGLNNQCVFEDLLGHPKGWCFWNPGINFMRCMRTYNKTTRPVWSQTSNMRRIIDANASWIS